MILKASQRAGGVQLAHHLMNADDNDHVVVHEVRGFMASDLYGAFKEAQAISKGTRCQQYLFSLSLNPPEKAYVEIEAFENTINDIEKSLNLKDHPRAIVFHEKEGRRHAHVVWSRIDPETMTAKRMSHFKTKLNRISRDLFLSHGWELPAGYDEAAKRDPLNYSLTEYHQAKRQNIDPQHLKALMLECWQKSDSRPAFEKALAEHCLFLARGDRRGFVAVDHNGEVYSLTRWLGVTSKQLCAKLGSEADLLSISDVLDNLNHKRDDSYTQKYEAAYSGINENLQAFETKRGRLKTKQAVEREALIHEYQEQNHRLNRAYLAKRSNRSAIKTAWDKITGVDQRRDHAFLQQKQTLKARYESDYQVMINRHLGERRLLQKDKKQLGQRRDRAVQSFRRDIGGYFQNHPTELILKPTNLEAFEQRQHISARNADILRANPDFIPNKLSEHHSVFTKSDIAKQVNSYVDGAEAFQTVLSSILASPNLVSLQDAADPNSQTYYATREMVEIEQEMMATSRYLSQDRSHGVHPDCIQMAIATQNQELQQKGFALSDEQKNAIQHITGTERLSCLIGYAGAGKSTALKAARLAWEAQGYTVHGAALAGKAASELQKARGSSLARSPHGNIALSKAPINLPPMMSL